MLYFLRQFKSFSKNPCSFGLAPLPKDKKWACTAALFEQALGGWNHIGCKLQSKQVSETDNLNITQPRRLKIRCDCVNCDLAACCVVMITMMSPYTYNKISYFRFPFYYEVKIIFLIWLISPVSRGSLGSSILYRRFVHPALLNREEVLALKLFLEETDVQVIMHKRFRNVFLQEIDLMILKLQEQGYNTVTKLAVRGFNYVSNLVMQTAIRVSVFTVRISMMFAHYYLCTFWIELFPNVCCT